MTEYLVSVPYGANVFRRWVCLEEGCKAMRHYDLLAGDDLVGATRELACAHVRETGHRVLYQHGTGETLVPVRTHAEDSG